MELEAAARGRMEQPGGALQLAGRAAQHEAVVIADDALDPGDVAADRLGRAEIHRRALDAPDLAGGNELAIDGGVEIRLDGKLMVEHLAGAMAGQIPIAVMDEIADRRPIGLGFDLQDEAVLLVEAVDDRGIEIAGKTLLAIGRAIGKGDGAAVRRGAAGPEMLVETPEAAMQMIAALVAAQLMGFSVEDEPAAADAIAVAPADRPEIAVRDEIGGEAPARPARYPRAAPGGPVRGIRARSRPAP